MAPAPTTKTIRSRPLSGWALSKLILLDAAHPGILRFAHQASYLRRQAIFLTLSHLFSTTPEDLAARLGHNGEFSKPVDFLKTISTALMTLRVRDLTKALHPGVEGLAGALNRLGDHPLLPLKYRTLVQLLSHPDQRRAKVLRQTGRISETTLVVLRIIDAALLFPDLLRHFRTIKDIEAFVATVELIRRIVPGATDAALRSSLRAMGPGSSLEGWAQRWIAKAVFPYVPPIDDDEEWRVLRTGKAMQETAGRFGNCLKSGDKIAECALGRAAYIEWRSVPAILELAALTGPGGQVTFAVQGVHGLRNACVPPQALGTICAKARAADLLVPAKLGHARQHNGAERLLGVWDFGGNQGFPADDLQSVEAYIDEIVRG